MSARTSDTQAKTLAFLRRLALLTPLPLLACSSTTTPDVIVGSDSPNPADIVVVGWDRPNPPDIDVAAVDVQSADTGIWVADAVMCDGIGGDGASVYVAVNPPIRDIRPACAFELRPHVGEPCGQPGYSCGDPMAGLYYCPNVCPLVWRLTAGGPLAPPSLTTALN